MQIPDSLVWSETSSSPLALKTNDFFRGVLKFFNSPSDSFVYLKYEQGAIMINLVYVDDILLAADNMEAINWMKGVLFSWRADQMTRRR